MEGKGPGYSVLNQDGRSGDSFSPGFRDYVAVVRIRKGIIVTVATLFFLGVMTYSVQQEPLYESASQVHVKNPGTTSGEVATTVPPNLETEREIAESQAVGNEAARILRDDSGDLLDGLSVQWPLNTELLTFRYLHRSPVTAQRRADAFARAYLEYRRQQTLDDLLAASSSVQRRIERLQRQSARVNRRIDAVRDETERATLRSQASSLASQTALLQQQLAELAPAGKLRVGEVIDSADLPPSPVSPNHLNSALLGLVGGLVLGIGSAFLRERLDDRLRGRDDLESLLHAPAFAAVPRIPGWKRRKRAVLVTLSQPRSAAAEAYKTLRTGFLFSAGKQGAKVIMVTSPHAGEGKTVTTANLGVALAQAGKRVILISADLRKPRLNQFFGLANQTGLTNVLSGEVSPWQAVRNTGVENLQVMPSGPVPGNPAELLGSNAMGNLLSVPNEMADYVLVDAAPLLAVADAATLAPLVDAVLFVVDAQSTHRGAVQQARRQLEQVNALIIGAVLNNFDPSKAGAYSYYRYTYRYEEPDQVQRPEEAEERTNVLRWRSGTKG